MTGALELNVTAQLERIKLTCITRRLRQRYVSADPASKNLRRQTGDDLTNSYMDKGKERGDFKTLTWPLEPMH